MLMCLSRASFLLLGAIGFLADARPVGNRNGLYTDQDDMTILRGSTFDQEFYGKEHAWLVEFYASWCGHCQRFAPVWKNFAKDVRLWKGVVNVAVVDCSNDENERVCNQFSVTGYPTIRYFHEKFTVDGNKKGITFKKDVDLENMKKSLIDLIVAEQSEGRGKQYPSMQPYIGTDVTYNENENDFSFVIIQDDASTLGPQLVLDLHCNKQGRTIYATSKNKELMKNLNAYQLPHVAAIYEKNKFYIFPSALKTRNDILEAMRKFAPSAFCNYSLSEDSSNEIYKNEAEPENAAILRKIGKMGDALFYSDLESALRYMLKHEIGAIGTIGGDKLKTLKNILQTFLRYFPFKENGLVFKNALLTIIKSRTTMNVAEIVDLVTEYENDSRKDIFKYNGEWIGCLGSQPHLRGYPCGLWTFFHYITVQAAEEEQSPNALLRIFDFVKNIFGCEDCSTHFQKMAIEFNLANVKTADEAVLWLWKGHNEVNARLAKDSTEDPYVPKQQYPALKHCLSCENGNGTFIPGEVLTYLKRAYNKNAINYVTLKDI